MNVLIIEDEMLAAEGLERQIKIAEPTATIVGTLESVRDALVYFKEKPMPDIVFSDIQLADGLSFEIFEQVEVKCPIVFTTAYDAFALKAFKVNAVDYILKPCAAADIAKALEKIRLLQGEKQEKTLLDTAIIQRLSETFTPPQYKQRFLVKLGDNMTSVPVEDILFFWSENKIVFLRHTNGKKYIANFTLEQLENVLNPQHFFRINRQFLLSLTAIKQLTAHSNSRLKVFLNYPPDENEVIVARERVEAFKNWLDR